MTYNIGSYIITIAILFVGLVFLAVFAYIFFVSGESPRLQGFNFDSKDKAKKRLYKGTFALGLTACVLIPLWMLFLPILITSIDITGLCDNLLENLGLGSVLPVKYAASFISHFFISYGKFCLIVPALMSAVIIVLICKGLLLTRDKNKAAAMNKTEKHIFEYDESIIEKLNNNSKTY